MAKRLTYRVDIGAAKEFQRYGDTPIDEIVDYLTQAKVAGATHVRWLLPDSEWDSDGEMQPFYWHTETDEDIAARIEKERLEKQEQRESTLRREREVYEALKRKFEPNQNKQS